MRRVALLALLVAVPALAQRPPVPRSLRALPPIDAAIAPDFATALPLVDHALRMRAPRMTDAVDPQKLNRRVNETLRPWLQNRMAAMQAAETALHTVAARSPAHAAVAAALSALLLEDFANQIAGIAPPRTLRNDPQMVAIWNQVLGEQVTPYRDRARAAYEACAHAAPPGAWATYCSAHVSL